MRYALFLAFALCAGGSLAQERPPSAALAGALGDGLAPLETLSPSQAPLPPIRGTAKAISNVNLTGINHERVLAKADPMPSLHAQSGPAIAAAAAHYRAIAQAGGWPILPAKLMLAPGDSGEAVAILRQRLLAEGDLSQDQAAAASAQGLEFGPDLMRAVKAFQARHGQSQTGIVEGVTLAALRVPAANRAQHLEESARRLENLNFAFARRHVLVNIPAAAIEAIEGGQVVRRYLAVVGKPDRPSPEVQSRILSVNFNPTWTLPVSIVKKDIIPKMRKDPTYLAKAKIRIFGASGQEIEPARIDWTTERAAAFTLRQDAGSANALGQIRIDMPNHHAVYMHDTASKRLFLSDDRFHSSGCVRVHDVRAFVGWLLEDQQDGEAPWTSAAIKSAIDGGKRKDVRLKDPVPVIWAYLTGYVTQDGRVHFREDIYGMDDLAILAAQVQAPEPSPIKPVQLAEPQRPRAVQQAIDPR